MSILFFRSFFKFSEDNPSLLIMPFLFGVMLFGGFLVMDEILIAYDKLGPIEQSHFGLFMGMLISLLVIR